jgi:hypothetical protein
MCVELGEKDDFEGDLPGVIEDNIKKARHLFDELRAASLSTMPPTPGSSRALTASSQTRNLLGSSGKRG